MDTIPPEQQTYSRVVGSMFTFPVVHASGEEHAEVVVRIVGVPPVHVHTVRVEVTRVDEVAVRVALHSCHPSVSRKK